VRNKRKTETTFSPPPPSSQAQFHSSLFYLLPTKWHRDMGNEDYDQFITLHLCNSFFLSLFP